MLEEEESVPCSIKPELAYWVKGSAPVTDSVLAEGTHQTECHFGDEFMWNSTISDYRGEVPESPLAELRCIAGGDLGKESRMS